MVSTRDLAQALIWGILFRLPCARFVLAGHTTSAQQGASGPNLGARLFRSPTRLRAGDTPERGERLNHDR